MANQLIPPPGVETAIPAHFTAEQRVAIWVDLMDTTEALVLAGLRQKVGPDGDVRQAYRQWYQQQMEEHDRCLRQQAENMYRRGVRHGN